MYLAKNGNYVAGWIPICSGLLMFLSSIVAIFYEQFSNLSETIATRKYKKKKRTEFYELHRYVIGLDKNTYQKEISVVQFSEKMNECIQWKKQTQWLEENHVDVEAEFPEKVKEVDEMMEKLTQNNKL